MKIKAEYRDREITIKHAYIPKGITMRLGDLKASEVRALYHKGMINDDMLEPKKTKAKSNEEAPDSNSSDL